MSHYSLERSKERQARRAKVSAMRKRDLAEYFFATPCKAQQDLAAIPAIPHPLQEAMRLEAVHELDGAVMLNLKAFGKQADRGAGRSRQSLNGKQRLILLRFDTRGARRLLAQILKAAHLVSKFGQGAIINVFVGGSFQGQANIS